MVYHLKLLCVWLTHNLEDTCVQSWLGQSQGEFLESLKRNLYMPTALPLRSRRDESETTTLFHALLRFSGATADFTHREFDEKYSVCDNANLIASVLGISIRPDFGQHDFNAVADILCISWMSTWVHKGMEDWAKLAMENLRIGFPKQHLVSIPIAVVPLM